MAKEQFGSALHPEQLGGGKEITFTGSYHIFENRMCVLSLTEEQLGNLISFAVKIRPEIWKDNPPNVG